MSFVSSAWCMRFKSPSFTSRKPFLETIKWPALNTKFFYAIGELKTAPF